MHSRTGGVFDGAQCRDLAAPVHIVDMPGSLSRILDCVYTPGIFASWETTEVGVIDIVMEPSTWVRCTEKFGYDPLMTSSYPNRRWTAFVGRIAVLGPEWTNNCCEVIAAVAKTVYTIPCGMVVIGRGGRTSPHGSWYLL